MTQAGMAKPGAARAAGIDMRQRLRWSS